MQRPRHPPLLPSRPRGLACYISSPWRPFLPRKIPGRRSSFLYYKFQLQCWCPSVSECFSWDSCTLGGRLIPPGGYYCWYFRYLTQRLLLCLLFLLLILQRTPPLLLILPEDRLCGYTDACHTGIRGCSVDATRDDDARYNATQYNDALDAPGAS